MKCSDLRRESFMPSSGMLSKPSLPRCPMKCLMLSMLSVSWPRRTPLTDSQFQDQWRDKLIGLFTTSTLRDGSSAGHSLEELLLCYSGSTFLIFTSLYAHRVLTMRTTSVLRMPRLVPFGKDVSGLSLIQCTDITWPLCKEALSSTPIIQMTLN